MSAVEFFKASAFAVVGASADRSKFGNRVLRWYLENAAGASLFPINPKAPEIEGVPALQSLRALPNPAATSVSVITPPAVTEAVLREAVELGIRNVWLQPGSESAAGMQYARDHGVNVIGGGPCILVSGAAAKAEAAARL
ncbi:hypothetical protein HK105_206125 [Polyrhizophydium stewartii]|uniref:CoA-binding domain-containing protein n=1 Tax=Polyrhizophydium stewartii TaxID=2732419 RepID=A0ABR4N4C6_9FUNG